MHKTLTLLFAAASLTFATSAFAGDVRHKSEVDIKKSDDGSVDKKAKVENENPAGKASTTVSNELDVHGKGDTTNTNVVEKVSDPKGLLNKKTDTRKEVTRTKDGKTKIEVEHTINGKTVEAK